jgi:hypothetical protein
MSEPENGANNITSLNPGFYEPSDQYLMHISASREVIRSLSALLIDTDWRRLTCDSRELKTMEEQLRVVIKDLELLGNNPSKGKIDMDAILNALYSALVELYKASDLSDTPDILTRSSRYDNFIACRNYLNLAITLMPQYNG